MKLGDKRKAMRPQGRHERKVLMSLAVKVDAVRSTSQRWAYLFSHSIIKTVTGLDFIQCSCSEDDDLWILDVHLGLKKIFPLCLGIRVILIPKKANIKRQLSIIYIDNGRTQILCCMKTQFNQKSSFQPVWTRTTKAQIHSWHNAFEVGGTCPHAEHIKPLNTRM